MARHDADLLAVLPTPRSPQKWITTPQVAEALQNRGIEINHVKTVQRWLNALQDQGVVESRPAGRALEWQKREGASGIAVKAGGLMTFDEALALQVLRRFAARQIPTLVNASLGGLFEVSRARLERGENTSDGRRHARWDRKIAVVEGAFKLLRPGVKDAVFQAVSRGLFTEQLLEIRYRSNRTPPEPASRQTVMPLGLVEAGDLVYLVAQVPNKPRAVMYRLDRMDNASVTDESFTYPRSFSLASYVEEEKMFDYFPAGTISLALRFAPDFSRTVTEAPLSEDQTIEMDDNGVATVRATVMMSERLRWWIRSFGPGIEVLEPAELRESFVAEARAAYALYTGRRAR